MKQPPSLIKLDDDLIKFVWKSLESAGYDANEGSLLQAIKDNRSKKTTYYAVLALRKIGSSKSIPALKRLRSYPDEDVIAVHVLTIASIAREKETSYYVELLKDPEFKQKSYPLAALWEVGDSSGLESVVAFSKEVLSDKVDSRYWDWSVDPLYLSGYIDKYSRTAEHNKITENISLKYEKKNRSIKSIISRLYNR